jgi:sarcosine oxidase subunit alpha
VRLARVSFTGERAYELTVPAHFGAAVWDALIDHGATPFGIESLSLLRAEKGYILIGTDTDGLTLPMDLGMSGPLRAKQVDFVGKRSLLTQDAQRTDRRQLVGLVPVDPNFVPAVGSHAIESHDGNRRSIGWITSSGYSPTLKQSICLGMIEGGRARIDTEVTLYDRGQISRAKVTSPCFLDHTGERLNG